ncbi:hypothetical protein CWM61_17990 [Klebsiella sp. K-Nf6]|nr:hypothetical protein CWM61_17990 [Klebsiella sp. K-Nf6]
MLTKPKMYSGLPFINMRIHIQRCMHISIRSKTKFPNFLCIKTLKALIKKLYYILALAMIFNNYPFI